MLPSLYSDRLFAADGGLETTMIFDQGLELPCFASFLLLRDDAGIEALRRYYRGYIEIARRHGLGFTLDTPTWRANRDWGERLGYSAAELAAVNRHAVRLAEEIREEEQGPETPIAICGSIGPRGDAYEATDEMDATEAEAYHSEQVGHLCRHRGRDGLRIHADLRRRGDRDRPRRRGSCHSGDDLLHGRD